MLRVMTNGVDHVARGVGDEIRVERLRQQIAQRAERQKKFGVRFVCHGAHIRLRFDMNTFACGWCVVNRTMRIWLINRIEF